jgi:hypothetical protein
MIMMFAADVARPAHVKPSTLSAVPSAWVARKLAPLAYGTGVQLAPPPNTWLLRRGYSQG